MKLLLFLLGLLELVSANNSPKRGLVYISNGKKSDDDSIWAQTNSDLTWYYNYGQYPSQAFSKRKLQFVPMLWGSTGSSSDTRFSDAVKSLISDGYNISHVLGFNEPDEGKSTGGSDMSTDTAAAIWIREIEPLRKLGIKTGAPAVTGSPRGLNWLADFFTKCKGGCTADFLPLHWYGDFGGMASFIGQAREKYPNLTMWFTEFALPKATLTDTESFYNISTDYLDRLDYVSRYAYFGSFRSDASSIGPNVAMLDKKGDLTDIGSWYLGDGATGRKPSGAGRISASTGCVALFTLTVAWSFL